MTSRIFAEYNTARTARLEAEKSKNNAFLFGLGLGMIVCLGVQIALAQFGIALV